MPQSTSLHSCSFIAFSGCCASQLRSIPFVKNNDTTAEDAMIAPLCCVICFGSNHKTIDCLHFNKLSDPLCCIICFGSNHETKDCLHFNKLYGNRKELLLKEKDVKSTPIPPSTGSICCFGSQSSVVQNTDTTEEDAEYALFAAVAEDRIWNTNKLSQLDHKLKSTTKKYHSTPLTVD